MTQRTMGGHWAPNIPQLRQALVAALRMISTLQGDPMAPERRELIWADLDRELKDAGLDLETALRLYADQLEAEADG